PPDRTTIVARLPLQPPLDGFTLAAEISGDDPAASLAFRNRTWYIAALALLYTGIGVGFGLTIREMRRAYKLSRLKTDFVANISHELRTPLTSVRLFAETLKQGRAQGPREVQECLDLLTKETQRLSSLVEKLLDWSRLESGRKLLRREPTEVPALLAHVADVFKAQQLGATYETHIEADLPKVSLDRDAMAQVVLNLLHNAVKFTGPDKQIRLRARRRDGGVAIEVEDNGIGVREKDRKRIFERFYRSDDLLSRRTEGTGLGLAIAKRLVEAHGGKIDVVILDVMLPGRNGYELLKELRRRAVQTPVLMLTAKGMEGDKILGLKLGADDYLAKPFGLGELLARVEALLRRRPPRDDRAA